MNEARFLRDVLGYVPPPLVKTGLACPAIITSSRRSSPSAYIETREEVAAFVDSNRTVADRAFPKRAQGSTMF